MAIELSSGARKFNEWSVLHRIMKNDGRDRDSLRRAAHLSLLTLSHTAANCNSNNNEITQFPNG